MVVPGQVRIVNKYVLDPAMMQLAGRKHWYASVIEHTGRRSGKTYATPVVAEPVTGGFIVPLPYGTEVDWVRNVLAAGHATLCVHGENYPVARHRSSAPPPRRHSTPATPTPLQALGYSALPHGEPPIQRHRIAFGLPPTRGRHRGASNCTASQRYWRSGRRDSHRGHTDHIHS